LFVNFSSFKPNTENNANSDAVTNKRAKFDEVQDNTLINELLLVLNC